MTFGRLRSVEKALVSSGIRPSIRTTLLILIFPYFGTPLRYRYHRFPS